MKKSTKSLLLLIGSYLIIFGIGISSFPLLVPEKSLTLSEIKDVKDKARYVGVFTKNQKGSNLEHWVDGKIYVSDKELAFEGNISPRTTPEIYLTKTQTNDEESFLKIKNESLYIGYINTFGNFRKNIPNNANIDEYTAVQIWCGRFEKFLASAKYK